MVLEPTVPFGSSIDYWLCTFFEIAVWLLVHCLLFVYQCVCLCPYLCVYACACERAYLCLCICVFVCVHVKKYSYCLVATWFSRFCHCSEVCFCSLSSSLVKQILTCQLLEKHSVPATKVMYLPSDLVTIGTHVMQYFALTRRSWRVF